MKVLLLQVGKTANRNFISAITDYYQRISHYVPFEIQTIAELKGTKSLSESQQKEREGEMILRTLQPSDTADLPHGWRSSVMPRGVLSLSSGGHTVLPSLYTDARTI